jgi:hypothetical protein
MARTTKPIDEMTAKRRAAEAGKPAVDQAASDENALESASSGWSGGWRRACAAMTGSVFREPTGASTAARPKTR